MEQQWRNPLSWRVLGASRHEHPPAPVIPPRPKVRVRAIGDRRFLLDGEIVPEGTVVYVDADSAAMLLFAGKVVLA